MVARERLSWRGTPKSQRHRAWDASRPAYWKGREPWKPPAFVPRALSVAPRMDTGASKRVIPKSVPAPGSHNRTGINPFLCNEFRFSVLKKT